MDIPEQDDWVVYVPAWRNNREEANPITVEIRPLTMAESARYAGMVVSRGRPGFRGQSQDNSIEVARRQFFEHCQNIRNLSYGGRPITTPEGLWASPFMDLVSELTDTMNDYSMLQEGEAKNFGSQSGGSTKASTGTATSAP